MGKFEKYFLMNEDDVAEYIREKGEIFAKNAKLSCQEIGDGNLNYVFRVSDENGKSVIVKHSGTEPRTGSGRKLAVDRNRVEAEILQMQNSLCPGYVPEIYWYDSVMCCCVMEDLKDYSIFRTALLDYKTFPLFADLITNYLVDVLLPTTDIAMNHKEKKELVKKYINPDLCEISEQLVYSDSLGNFAGKNSVVEPLRKFVDEEIYQNKKLRLEGAKLKFEFMEHAQALIHGDLHSGSIFVNDKEVKVFDPEFAFYGPIGYDVGNVIAHIVLAMIHSEAMLDKEDKKRIAFRDWALKSIEDIVDMFKDKYEKKFAEIVTDNMAKTEGFAEYYLEGILRDTSAVAGLEILRRIVGGAKVKDVTSIADENVRAEKEEKGLRIAKEMIMNRNTMRCGKDYKILVDTLL
ncbi:MAG: S-methyl-5-thioribose kinase [Faecalimonas umbilicata]|uniref:S-methyl-5-thioribose kinase n=1 Tax=Faecalimonas umbilicata TaxID=1912855 RepID=UPI002432C76D|nr:S-methyl-5-thioribose kinase [Faecalimonas umbilicata]MCI5986570.1 S-methyl-5-thioribose kinase [Faecalimonas umbilicata]MDY5093934.1 S-methyl-5-thioribose kinase [Faecalimonas umbilicata]